MKTMNEIGFDNENVSNNDCNSLSKVHYLIDDFRVSNTFTDSNNQYLIIDKEQR